MELRNDLKYTRTHQWIREEGEVAMIGITDYAQSQLGGIIFVNLPDVGDDLIAGKPFGEVESVKVVSDVYSPVSGRVVEINEAAVDEPETVNGDPYGIWLVKASEITGYSELMTKEEYRAFLKGLGA